MLELAREFEIPSVCLHSGLSQRRRLAALGKFKSGQMRLLFATDVASRGLDIPKVQLVINYDIPATPRCVVLCVVLCVCVSALRARDASLLCARCVLCMRGLWLFACSLVLL